jgi:hypothetical protein
MSAGVSVTATTIAISTVSASPGPNARSTASRAVPSAAEPAATIRPAVTMIGMTSAVARRGGRQPRVSLRQPPAHAGQEEHRVVAGHAEQQDQEHRFQVRRHGDAGQLPGPRHHPDGHQVGHPAHASVASGAPADRNCRPTMTTIASIVANSTRADEPR